MFGLPNTGAGLDLVNLDFRQSVEECHPNLVLKFSYLNDMDDVDLFNICGVDEVKEKKQLKGEVYVTVVITYKTNCVVNIQPVTVSITLG